MKSAIVEPSCNYKNIELWHFKTRHPSLERLNKLQSYYLYITTNKDYVCNTCHQSKQNKLSFPLSDYHALKPFHLLHINIWGPCFVSSMHD